MQLIQGEIVAIMPPNFSDSWGNQYQDVTVRTVSGDILGQKASKTALTENDVGAQVEWNIEVKQNSKKQNYNKFTKPKDPQYTSQDTPQNQQQGVQKPAQATKAPQGNQPAYLQPNQGNKDPDWDAIAEGKVRHGVVCAYISARFKPEIKEVERWVKYIITGIDPDTVPDPDPEITECPHCRKPHPECSCTVPF